MTRTQPVRLASTTAEFWEDWDRVVAAYGTNGFYHSNLVRYYAETVGREWTPQLICRPDGVAALKTRGHFGVRLATQLLSPGFGTEPVIEPRHRKEFVHDLLADVFGRLRCQTLDLSLPSESPILPIIRKAASSSKLYSEEGSMKSYQAKHSVLPVAGTWEQFRRSRGPNFSHHFKKIERDLGRAGKLAVHHTYIDNESVVAKISEVEEKSWKGDSRKGEGVKDDEDLTALLRFWRYEGDNRPPMVWIMELDGKPVAYQIAMTLNGVAIFCKTSYDQSYAGLSCGVYVCNRAIRELFGSGDVSLIDFLTPLPYLERWTSERLGRTRLVISKPVPLVTPMASYLQKNRPAKSAYGALKGLSNLPRDS